MTTPTRRRKRGKRKGSDRPSGGSRAAQAGGSRAGGGMAAAEKTSAAAIVGLWLAFGVVLLAVYGPALGGAFISDDEHYVEQNPYIHDLFEPANFVAIWDPTSIVTTVVENYAPVHLLIHGIEWQLFGESVTGYHVVNLFVHALAAALLFLLFARSGIPRAAALVGAAIFLVHPGNVESVAWISQVKSSASLVLTLAAVLSHPRRPWLSLVFFALGLLAKPFAAVAFFAVLLFGWVRTGPPAEGVERPAEPVDWRWPWMAGWVLVLAAFAVVEVVAFSSTAGQVPTLYGDTLTRACMMIFAGGRYLWMTVSGTGLSIFHEPEAITSLLDPAVLVSLVALGVVAARFVVVLVARREEAVYWAWALIAFAPMSGVVPLPYPIADRYLYFVLPGLIGAVLLALPDLAEIARARFGLTVDRQTLGRIGLAVACVFIAVFTWQAHARSAIWVSAETMMADAERNYPDGAPANTRKAGRAAQQGDFASAVRYLEAANARGYNNLEHLLIDPRYGPMQTYPAFVEFKQRIARGWIARLGSNPAPSQVEARALAQAYIVMEDLESALRVIEAATHVEGPMRTDLEGDAVKLRAEIARRERFKALEARRAASED